jgi:hypothetical protein
MVFFKRKKWLEIKRQGKRFFAETVELFQGSMFHAGRYHMHAIKHASSGYKSQRRDRAEGGRQYETEGGEREKVTREERKKNKERGERKEEKTEG